MVYELILLSAIAGIAGTGLGGFISAILMKCSSEAMACRLLSFAAGIMTSIVCFGLIRESLELSGLIITIPGLVLGIAILITLNRLVDTVTSPDKAGRELHHTHEELYHAEAVVHNQSHMLRSGMIMLVAIGLHNFPEGLAIGAGGSHSIRLGIMLAITIALHNVPEGMAIATPLMMGGLNKGKVVLLTTASGIPSLLGGLLGVFIGSISDYAVSMVLSTAGGAMLYVVFGEIIPQSVILTKNRSATIMTLLGIIIGLIICNI